MKRCWMLLLWALLCTACTALPAEERSFAVALGVDKQGTQWTACARVPTYQTGGGYSTVRGEGETLEAALSALDAGSPMQLHLGQLRMIVFTDDLAKTEDFPAALDALSARHDLRMAAFVAVTDTDLMTLMEAMNPANGSRLSKSLDVLIETRIEQGTVLPAVLSDVIRMGERQSPVLMHLSLSGKDVALSGSWPVSQKGVVTEPFSPEETQLLSLMLGQLTTGTLSLTEGTVRLTSATAQTELSLPTMQDASVRLMLRYTASPLTEDALSRAVATACLGVLNRLSGMNCDALGLARQAISHAHDMDDWHDMDWAARYPDIVWSVSVGAEGETGN